MRELAALGVKVEKIHPDDYRAVAKWNRGYERKHGYDED